MTPPRWLRTRFLAPLLQLSLSALSPESNGCDCNDDEGQTPVVVTPDAYDINVVFLALADDDGAHASSLTTQAATQWLDEVTTLYGKSDVKVRFHFDTRSVLAPLAIKSTLMNHDCHRARLTVLQAQDSALDPGAVCVWGASDEARKALANTYPDALVVMSRYFSDFARFDAPSQHWVVESPRATYGYSWGDMPMVVVGDNKWSGAFLSHEMGHYFHLAHTHYFLPKTIAEAATLLQAQLANGSSEAQASANAFDGDDDFGVNDTPADPGPEATEAVFGAGTACNATAQQYTVPTDVDGTHRDFVYSPNRANVMSYFKECAFQQGLSAGQRNRIHDAVSTGNRRPLLRDAAPPLSNPNAIQQPLAPRPLSGPPCQLGF